MLEVSQESNDASSNEARGLKLKMEKINFILILFLLEKILMRTNPLSEHLQSDSQNIVNAVTLIKATKSSLNELRSQEFYSVLYKDAKAFGESLGVIDKSDNFESLNQTPNNKSKRRRDISIKLQGYFVTSTTGNQEQNSTLKKTLKKIFALPFTYQRSIKLMPNLIKDSPKTLIFYHHYLLLIHHLPIFFHMKRCH